jgi:hypothetical protein
MAMSGKKKFLMMIGFMLFLAPVALAGGPSFDNEMQQQQMEAPQTKVIVQLPEDKGFFSSEVIAALIAGGLGLTGVVITLKARKKS